MMNRLAVVACAFCVMAVSVGAVAKVVQQVFSVNLVVTSGYTLVVGASAHSAIGSQIEAVGQDGIISAHATGECGVSESAYIGEGHYDGSNVSQKIGVLAHYFIDCGTTTAVGSSNLHSSFVDAWGNLIDEIWLHGAANNGVAFFRTITASTYPGWHTLAVNGQVVIEDAAGGLTLSLDSTGSAQSLKMYHDSGSWIIAPVYSSGGGLSDVVLMNSFSGTETLRINKFTFEAVFTGNVTAPNITLLLDRVNALEAELALLRQRRP